MEGLIVSDDSKIGRLDKGRIASRIETERDEDELTVQCSSRKEVLVKKGRRLTCTLSDILDKSHWPLCAAIM